MVVNHLIFAYDMCVLGPSISGLQYLMFVVIILLNTKKRLMLFTDPHYSSTV